MPIEQHLTPTSVSRASPTRQQGRHNLIESNLDETGLQYTRARTHTHTHTHTHKAQVALVLLISYRDEVLYKIEQTVIELRDGIVEK